MSICTVVGLDHLWWCRERSDWTQNPALPPGFTPEQMQAMIAFFMQNQANAGGNQPDAPCPAPSGSASSTQSSVAESMHEDDIVMIDPPSKDCPPTPVKTPPRRKATKAPPATPRAPGNHSTKSGAAISSATSTPSSKMAQLTLEGRKLPSTPVRTGKRRPSASSAIRKGPVPTGEDPILTFEDDDSVFVESSSDPSDVFSAGGTKNDAGQESDPYEGFPEIVTAPPPDKGEGDKADEERGNDVYAVSRSYVFHLLNF
ncbi:hypothetical protein K525DRAFT_275220 [Schizophyllum commune Loenen D]|nr:hypothetical protein K525DRAFT_275220 [Schizophyllum commune Loenen D]